jgi:hypothetical protein
MIADEFETEQIIVTPDDGLALGSAFEGERWEFANALVFIR